ncbi:MAG: DUF2299 family protein [Candidatus Hermodarchaeota archaeon]
MSKIIDNMTKKSEQVKQKLTMWLTEENLFEKSIPPQKGLIYGFLFRFPPKSPALYSVAVQENMPDSIMLARGIKTSPEHQNIIKNWKPKIRNEFLTDFLMNLHRYNVNFRIQYQDDTLLSFNVATRIFMETLTKAEFWNALTTLQNASQSSILQIQKSTHTFSMKAPTEDPLSLKKPQDTTGMFG